MISNFLRALKESGKLSLAGAIVFFLGVLISAYFLFTLPHSLVVRGGLPTLELAWPLFTQLFISVGITFTLGIIAINIAIQSRKETLVYIEKKRTEESLSSQRDEGAVGGLQDLAAFTTSLKSKGENGSLQEGLNLLCQQLQAGQGALYEIKTSDSKRSVELKYGFALAIGESTAPRFELGEGLIGQAASSGKSVYLDEVPEGYINIVSGLGTASPRFVMIAPMKKDKEVKGVIEIATFAPISEAQRNRVEEIARLLAEKIK